jgi:hypothetical protein
MTLGRLRVIGPSGVQTLIQWFANDGMRRFGGFFTRAFHPNLMGCPGHLNMLYRLLEYMQSYNDVCWATCEQALSILNLPCMPVTEFSEFYVFTYLDQELKVNADPKSISFS